MSTSTSAVPENTVPSGSITATAIPTQVSRQYDPELIEVLPVPQTDLASGVTPIFYFNQPMDRATVEKSLRVEPSLPVRLEWLDDTTLRVIPELPAQLETGLSLSIDASARAVNGKSLTEPIMVEYPAPAKLIITQRLPEPDAVDVNPSSAIVVAFNRPAVALGAALDDIPAAFSIVPQDGVQPPDGRGEWLNTSTYIFYPKPALFGGSQYEIMINSEILSLNGNVTEPENIEQPWSFTTAAPVLLSLQPGAEQQAELDEEFVLTFNQPMDMTSVESNFSLVDPDGASVPGRFTWNDLATQVTFEPEVLLQRDTIYGLVLFGTAASQGGATLGQDFAASLTTVPQFGVTQTSPTASEALETYSGLGTIVLTFSSPVAPGQDFDRLVQITPEISGQAVSRSYDGYQIYLTGYFQPSTSYTLEVGADLSDRWRATLGLPYSYTFASKAARPSLMISGQSMGGRVIFVPYGDTSITAESTNIERLALSSGKLTLHDFIGAFQNWQGIQDWEPLVNLRWASLLYPTPDVTETIEIPLNPSGELLTPGLYFLKVDPQPVIDSYSSAPEMLVVSPVQMVLKTSLRQAFVWAVRVAGQQPMEGATVTIYDQNARSVASCKTDERGVCQAELPISESSGQTFYAAIGLPGDPNFSLTADNWAEGVSPWQFDVLYEREDLDPKVYLYTDRPIYQPGQALNIRAVVRNQSNGRYSASDLKDLTIDVISPYDPVTGQFSKLTSLRMAVDEFGAASGIYVLPENARTGYYLLQVQEVENVNVNFQVAEYRKPEINLEVNFVTADSLIGDDVQAQVSANYFFGAPASNVNINWVLYAERGYLDLAANLQTGRLDTSWMDSWNIPGYMSRSLVEGQATTGPNGDIQVSIPGTLIQERLGDLSENLAWLTLEVTAVDESGLPVSARNLMNLHPSVEYIGVQPENWMVVAGKEITYTIRTMEWNGKPKGNSLLFARFSKVTWKEQENSIPEAPPQYVMETSEVGSTEFRTSETGEARLAFLPAEPGTFMVEITGESGAITQALIWVGGVGQAAWPAMPNQRLLLRSDADEYTQGQTAKIFIPNPFIDGALALVTIERGQVMQSDVIALKGSGYEYELSLTEESSPNIYVSVTLLGHTAGRLDFRVGYLNLDVKPKPYLLNLQVQFSPPTPQPGDDVTVTLRALDNTGKPVQGEFSLALVDKAVLALADPNSSTIEDAFYGKQWLGVQSGYALAVYSGRSVYIPMGRGGGGGGDAGFAQDALRENFEDTAYWNGAMQTDVTGIAQITLTLPDNLTTWQADIRGVTAETLVGSVQADLAIGKPLLVRPVTPRFVVLGDHLEMATIVQNNTQEQLTASVRLEGPGFGLDNPDLAVQVIDLEPGGRQRVNWWGTVQDVESISLVFSAEANGLRDAARPEIGDLPVLSYTSSQVFGTSGVISEPDRHVIQVSLPRSFIPSGGDLNLDVSPSLSALILDGIRGLNGFPRDFTEPISSQLLPNLMMYSSLKDLQFEDQALIGDLENVVHSSVDQLMLQQNEDGGWGWAAGAPSDPYLSGYVLFGLARAYQAGVFVDANFIQQAQNYLVDYLVTPGIQLEGWQLDQLAFQYFVLQQSGGVGLDLNLLYPLRDKLSPWGKAFLSMVLESNNPGDENARLILSDLQASANRSATGANWQDNNPEWHSWSTPNFTTAVVTYAIARLDPNSSLLPDAARYLILNRKPAGTWNSSYDSAWALMALVEVVRGTGDLQARYTFNASLNGSPLINGQVDGLAAAINLTATSVGLPGLSSDEPNILEIEHGEGAGQLYYRAFLNISQPVQGAPAISRGLTITRQYFLSDQDCHIEDCLPVTTASLADPQPLVVRLTLTAPEDMYTVVVEDHIPAGVEVLNPQLKTSSQVSEIPGDQVLPFDPANPFNKGWGWWLFQNPQVYDESVRWVVNYLPAGTYELMYRITPFLAGEFRVIPARAYQFYFPDVEGISAGEILTIE